MPPSSPPRHVTGRAHDAAHAEVSWILDDLLPRECRDRLWDDARERGVTSRSLRDWRACFGTESAALAIAAGLSEEELRYHLDGGPVPAYATLEMLADLNCFPFMIPNAGPVDLPLAHVSGGPQ